MKFMHYYKKYGILLIVILLSAVFAFLSPAFLSVTNIINISKQITIMAILSVGMTFVLLTGGIELSMGSVVSLSVVTLSIYVIKFHWGIWPAMIAVVLASTLLGLVDGLIIAKIKVPALIITLGMQIFLYGFTYSICGGLPVYGVPNSLKWVGQTYILGYIPVSALLMVIIVAIGAFLLEKTYLGRYLFAIGSNETATNLSGINTDFVRVMAYTLCGFLSGVAGIIMLGRIGSGQPSAGEGYEMDVLTGCVLGGVSLTGGKGNLLKAFCGVLVIGILSNGMSMVGLNTFMQKMVKGLVLMIAVILDSLQYIRVKKKVKVIQ